MQVYLAKLLVGVGLKKVSSVSLVKIFKLSVTQKWLDTTVIDT